jgi:hypothetical protein
VVEIAELVDWSYIAKRARFATAAILASDTLLRTIISQGTGRYLLGPIAVGDQLDFFRMLVTASATNVVACPTIFTALTIQASLSPSRRG